MKWKKNMVNMIVDKPTSKLRKDCLAMNTVLILNLELQLARRYVISVAKYVRKNAVMPSKSIE